MLVLKLLGHLGLMSIVELKSNLLFNHKGFISDLSFNFIS